MELFPNSSFLHGRLAQKTLPILNYNYVSNFVTKKMYELQSYVAEYLEIHFLCAWVVATWNQISKGIERHLLWLPFDRCETPAEWPKIIQKYLSSVLHPLPWTVLKIESVSFCKELTLYRNSQRVNSEILVLRPLL